MSVQGCDNITVDITDTAAQDISINVEQLSTMWGTIYGQITAQTDLFQLLSSINLQTLYYDESAQNLYISRGNSVSLSALENDALLNVLSYLSANVITLSSGNIITDLNVGDNLYVGNNTNIGDNLNVGDNLTVGGNFLLSGTLTTSNSAAIGGGMTIDGDTFVNGALYTTTTAYVLDTYFTNVGDGVNNTFLLQHNLETQDLYVTVRDTATNIFSYPAVQATSLSAVTISFNYVPPPNAFEVSIFAGKPSNRVSAYKVDLKIPPRPLSNVLYVSMSGDDANIGSDPNFSLRSIKKACQIAHNNRVLSKNNSNVKYTIFVSTGDYYEQNPVYVPTNTSIIGDNLRRTSILPVHRQYDVLWVDTSVYVWGFTFRNHLDPSAATAFLHLRNPVLTAIGLSGLFTPFVRSTLTYNKDKCKRDVGFILSAVQADFQRGNNQQSIINGLAYYSGMNLVLPNSQITPTVQAIQYAQRQTKNYVSTLHGSSSLSSLDLLFNTVTGIISGGTTNYTSQTFLTANNAASISTTIGNYTEQIKTEVIAHLDFLYPDIYKWRRPYVTTSPYIQGSSSITQALPPQLQFATNQKLNTQTFVSAPCALANVEIIIDTIVNIISNGYESYSIQSFTPSFDTATAVSLISANTPYIQDKTIEYISKNFPFLTYNESKCRRDIGFILSAVSFDLQSGNNQQAIINGQAYYDGTNVSFLPPSQKIPTVNAFVNLKTLIGYVLKGNYYDRTDVDTAFDIITKIMTFGPDEFTFLNYDKDKCKRDLGYILDGVNIDIQSGNNQRAIINGQTYYNGMNLVLPRVQITPTVRAIQYAQTLAKNYAAASLATDSLCAIDISFNTLVGILTGGVNNFVTRTFPVPLNAGIAATAIEFNAEQIKTSVISYLDQLYPDSVRGIYPGALSAAQILRENTTFIQKETLAYLNTVYPNLDYNKQKCERDIGFILSAVQVDITKGDYQEAIYNGQMYYNGNNLFIPQTQVLPTIAAINYAKRLANFITTNQPVQGLGAGMGMRIDGDDAEGFLRSFVLDSYTQFNEGGKGIYVTNNGYAQLVSIFTICCTEGIRADRGGSLSMNNSNCSFGLSGIVGSGKSPYPVLTGTLMQDPFRTDQVYVSGVIGTDIFPDSDYYPDTLLSPLALDTRKIAFVPYNGLAFTIGNDATLYPIRGNPQFIGPTLTYNKEKCKRDVGFILSAVRVDIQSGNNSRSIESGLAYYNGMNLVIPTAQITPTVQAIQYAQKITKDYVLAGSGAASLTAIDTAFNTIISIIEGGTTNFTNQNFTVPADANRAASIIIQNTELIKASVIAYIDSIYNRGTYIFTVPENVRLNYTPGEPVRLYIRSVITTSSHTFEFIGSGTLLKDAVPALGGLTISENEACFEDGGATFFTSTNQAGDFRVGNEFTIVQETATIEGDTFKRSILTLVTPLTLALE
jgi:hypothetical protein